MQILWAILGVSLLLLRPNDPGNKVQAAAQKAPTVLIATLVRNKAHTLPYFLTCLEGLNYPKDRISIW